MITNADVVVIGAGAFGASTAYHLARRGRRVVLLDAHEPVTQTSPRAAGLTQQIRSDAFMTNLGLSSVSVAWNCSPKPGTLYRGDLAMSNAPMGTYAATDFLSQIVTATMDRPVGSRHPRHGFIYTLNYGSVPGTLAPDGDELDVYVLGEFEPLDTFTGRCIAVIHRLEDDDDKLVLVQDGKQYTDDQIRALTKFQERFFQSIILR
jgi:inorganic pyrophosphatase